MDNKAVMMALLLTAVPGLDCAAQDAASPRPLWARVLEMSDAGQLAYLNQRLNEGLREVPDDAVGMLILNRSALVLPIIEKKVEQVLKSPNPGDCFTDTTVDAKGFVDLAASLISYAGDEHALKAISKLMALDENRFGREVHGTLYSAQNTRNPFFVAYRGLDIGDPAVDRRILEWAAEQFEAPTEFWLGELKRWLADAMVEKYHRVPTETDWHFDPIVSRLKRKTTDPIHDDVLRLAATTRRESAK